MGIQLVFIKLDDNKDLFLEKNHIILEYISFSQIQSDHSDISYILLQSANIVDNNDTNCFKTRFCGNKNFMKVAEEINKYCDNLKNNLNKQYEFYKSSQVLNFFRDHSYEEIKDLLKNRHFEEYTEIMEKCTNIINTDLTKNCELYENDSYHIDLYLYNSIQNISKKLINYSSQSNIYYYVSF